MHPDPAGPIQRGAFQKMGLAILLSIGAAATIVACQPLADPAVTGTTDAAPPAPVTVAPAVLRTVAPPFSQVGRVEADQRVEIRPRVAGHVEAVLFREGALVRAGRPLFHIDARTFEHPRLPLAGRLDGVAGGDERAADPPRRGAGGGQ